MNVPISLDKTTQNATSEIKHLILATSWRIFNMQTHAKLNATATSIGLAGLQKFTVLTLNARKNLQQINKFNTASSSMTAIIAAR
jgi:hypothetical protein